MQRLFFAALAVFLLICGFYVFSAEGEGTFLKPQPEVSGESSKVEIINSWFPKTAEDKNADDLYLSAKSAYVVNFETGEVLFSKNAKDKLPAASTIKIMTAMLALDNAELDMKITVSKRASEVGENSMGLTEGEVLTLEELLHGMMLLSGNDAAVSIAEGIGSSEEKFVEMMNLKAKQLGLDSTRFINASGLDEDGKSQYTTAYDLTTIAHFAWQNYPEIREISSTYEKYLPAQKNHKDYLLYNDTNLLTSYPGVKGIKPGFTWEAGWCLVTYAENEGKKILGVILGSEDRRGEMVLLLDYAFAKYGIAVEHPGLDL